MAIELRQLRFLVAVSETGSISSAARTLYMTQPAVTIALRNLEREVGIALLQRHRRGVDLTPAGEAFLAKAKLALEQIDEATATARQLAANASGELRVGLLPATFSRLPRALVDAFHSQHPLVQVTFRELSYIGHTCDLLDGRADIGFLWPPYDEPRLRFHALSQEPRVLGVAEFDPLADRDSAALDDVLDLRFPGFHPASSGGWFEHWFFDDIRSACATTTRDETTSPFEMGLVVQQGRAIAPAAQSFARAFPAPGVRWLTLTDAPPATLSLAWDPCNRNPAQHAFVRLARALTGPDTSVRELIVSPPAPLRDRQTQPSAAQAAHLNSVHHPPPPRREQVNHCGTRLRRDVIHASRRPHPSGPGLARAGTSLDSEPDRAKQSPQRGF